MSKDNLIEFDVDELRQYFKHCPDTGTIWRRRALSSKWKVINNNLDNGYMHCQFKGKTIKCHRLIWALHYGNWPGPIIDHINRNRSDNRICNLREATAWESCINTSHCDTLTINSREDSHHSKYRFTVTLNNIQYVIRDHSKEKLELLKRLAIFYRNTCNSEGLRRLKESAKYSSKTKAGVTYYKYLNKWIARSRLNGKEIYLGYYSSKEAAIEAVNKFN